MRKGSIDPRAVGDDSRVLILDGDLLIDIEFEKKWWKPLSYKPTFSDANRKAFKYFNKVHLQYDDLIIVVFEHPDIYKEVLKEYLNINWRILSFDSEETFQNWVVMTNPTLYVTDSPTRRYSVPSAKAFNLDVNEIE